MVIRYPLSKLLEVYYCRELAAHIHKNTEKPSVIVNYATPGLCESELAREAGWGLYCMKLMFARTAEHGARCFVWAAAGGEESQGAYFNNGLVDQ